MGYYGNLPSTGENNAFRILDDISSFVQEFDGSSAGVVSTSAYTITLVNHRFTTGQRVVYSNGGGGDIGNLTDSTAYYIIRTDKNTIQLATTYNNAINSVSIVLNALGTGTAHTLTVGFDGVNTKFVATYDGGVKLAITRAAQIQLSVNGVLQEPKESKTPTSGYGIDSNSVIVFSAAPTSTDTFFGSIVAQNFATFDISDNTIDTFVGDGSTVEYTLSKHVPNNRNVLVTLDGVVQYPSDETTTRAYNIATNVLTFVSPPDSGIDIQVRHIGFAGASTSDGVTGFYGRTGNVVLADTDVLRGDGSQIKNLQGGKFIGDSVGIHTVSAVGINTDAVSDNSDLVGVGNSFQGIYVSNGMMIMDNTLNGNHYIGTAYNGLMAGPVTIDGTLSIDGVYVVV